MARSELIIGGNFNLSDGKYGLKAAMLAINLVFPFCCGMKKTGLTILGFLTGIRITGDLKKFEMHLMQSNGYF